MHIQKVNFNNLLICYLKFTENVLIYNVFFFMLISLKNNLQSFLFFQKHIPGI